MHLLGKQISKWWLALLVPLLLCSLPFLLILFFAANNLAGALLGPPAIWNRPWHTPSREDVVGSYIETERHWDHAETKSKATLVLKEHGAMLVSELPMDS